MDTPREAVFDDLTRQAAEACDVPMALISLVDERRQWFKSRFGVALTETPRDQAFCTHTLHTPSQQLIVPDATKDPRFATNPLVTGEPHIRFYAGVPLRSPEGRVLGTLCVLDRTPRRLSADRLDKLGSLAQRAAVQLALRRRAPAERRLTAGFCALLLLLLSLIFFCLLEGRKYLESDGLVDHTNEVIENVEKTLFQVQAAESSQRGYSSTGQEGFLQPYQAAEAALAGRLATLRNLVADNALQTSRCGALSAAIREKMAITKERIDQRRALGAAALEAHYMDGRGRASMERVAGISGEMINAENTLLRVRTAARAAGLHAAATTLLGTGLLCVGLLAGGFWLTRRG